MEPRKHAVTMKTEKTIETLKPLEGGKDTKENINNIDKHEISPAVSAVSPGQGLEVPDRAVKGRAGREAPAGPVRAGQRRSGPLRAGQGRPGPVNVF